MITKFDVGDIVLVPMTVTKIDINRKSEITYKLECKAMDNNKKDKDYVLFSDENDIVGKLVEENETLEPDMSGGDGNSDVDESENGDDSSVDSELPT